MLPFIEPLFLPHLPSPPKTSQYECRCGKLFASEHGLYGHRRACRGPPVPLTERCEDAHDTTCSTMEEEQDPVAADRSNDGITHSTEQVSSDLATAQDCTFTMCTLHVHARGARPFPSASGKGTMCNGPSHRSTRPSSGGSRLFVWTTMLLMAWCMR